jgi:beta-lactamase class A
VAEGKLMRAASTRLLLTELSKSQSAPRRLRAGLTPDTRLAHQSGELSASDDVAVACNDVGIAYVGGRTIVIVAMLHGAHGNEASRDATIAAVARAAESAVIATP